MRTDADRLEKYTAKYVATTVGLKIASQLSTMKSNFAAEIGSLAAIELQAQGLLNLSGTQTWQYATYYGFVREIWAKKRRGIAGATLTSQAVQLSVKYGAYLLDPGLLKSMALTLFGIVIP